VEMTGPSFIHTLLPYVVDPHSDAVMYRVVPNNGVFTGISV